eukprot:COSAG06_NODE_4_length_41837_cov_204.557597_35_plen_173_part_00
MSPLPAMGALPRPKLQAAPQADNKAWQQQQQNPRGDSRLAAAADGHARGRANASGPRIALVPEGKIWRPGQNLLPCSAKSASRRRNQLRGLTSNPSATATRARRPSSPRPTLRRISARIVIVITHPPRRPARCALPARLLSTLTASSRRKGSPGCIAGPGQWIKLASESVFA